MALKDPEKHREYSRNYYRDHREQQRIKQQLYREQNSDKIKANDKKYRESIPLEQRREYGKNYRENHPEYFRSYMHLYYIQHQDKHLEDCRKWASEHREYYVGQGRLRRARLNDVPSTLQDAQWEAIITAYKYRCAYCGRRLKKLTQDHVIPISKGGGHSPGNIVPSCQSCNSKKGNRAPPFIPAVRLMI